MAHILLIEPNHVLAKTAAGALRHAGYQVSIAADAQTGIHAADAQRPDLVLLELQLTVHDGIAFLHEFRSYADWQDIPVIIHTSIAPNRLKTVRTALAADLGVVDCLYKPGTSLSQLISAVNNQARPT